MKPVKHLRLKFIPRKIPFGVWLLLFFMFSWTLSLIALYLLLPALRDIIPIAAFALFASTFLISLCVTVAFLLLRTSYPSGGKPGDDERLVPLNPPVAFKN